MYIICIFFNENIAFAVEKNNENLPHQVFVTLVDMQLDAFCPERNNMLVKH